MTKFEHIASRMIIFVMFLALQKNSILVGKEFHFCTGWQSFGTEQINFVVEKKKQTFTFYGNKFIMNSIDSMQLNRFTFLWGVYRLDLLARSLLRNLGFEAYPTLISFWHLNFSWSGEKSFWYGANKEALLWLWKTRTLNSPQRRQLKKWQVIAFLATEFGAFFSGSFSELFGKTSFAFKLNICNHRFKYKMK